MIRPATLDDLPGICELGDHFRADSEYSDLADNPEQRAVLATRLITGSDSTVLVDDEDGRLVGMIGLLFFSHPLSGEPIVSEVFWWLEPDFRRGRRGLRLLAAAETWARDAGAVRLQMVAPNDDVSRLYEARGFLKRETLFERRIQ